MTKDFHYQNKNEKRNNKKKKKNKFEESKIN